MLSPHRKYNMDFLFFIMGWKISTDGKGGAISTCSLLLQQASDFSLIYLFGQVTFPEAAHNKTVKTMPTSQ